jgi:hypothetical protein
MDLAKELYSHRLDSALRVLSKKLSKNPCVAIAATCRYTGSESIGVNHDCIIPLWSGIMHWSSINIALEEIENTGYGFGLANRCHRECMGLLTRANVLDKRRLDFVSEADARKLGAHPS